MPKQELRSPTEIKDAVFYYKARPNLSSWQRFILQCLYVLAENCAARTLKVIELEKRIYNLEKPNV